MSLPKVKTLCFFNLKVGLGMQSSVPPRLAPHWPSILWAETTIGAEPNWLCLCLRRLIHCFRFFSWQTQNNTIRSHATIFLDECEEIRGIHRNALFIILHLCGKASVPLENFPLAKWPKANEMRASLVSWPTPIQVQSNVGQDICLRLPNACRFNPNHPI